MPIAEVLALHLQRLTVQGLSGSEVALFFQQRAELVDGVERTRMAVAERLALRLQHLAVQRLSGGEVVLVVQQRAEAADGKERTRMAVAECLALQLQQLAVQWLRGGAVALCLLQRLALRCEGTPGEACGIPIRALGLKPCTQKLEAKRIAVPVHAQAAAVGCVLLWARAPPFLQAVLVDPLDGAAAGARLHERVVLLTLQTQPARLLLRLRLLCLLLGLRARSHLTEAPPRPLIRSDLRKQGPTYRPTPYESQLFGWNSADFPIDQLGERQICELKVFSSIPGRSNMEREEFFQKMWRPNVVHTMSTMSGAMQFSRW
eukprot:scaffold47396_cov67-Phaeocystis_antarctica.AAC.2